MQILKQLLFTSIDSYNFFFTYFSLVLQGKKNGTVPRARPQNQDSVYANYAIVQSYNYTPQNYELKKNSILLSNLSTCLSPRYAHRPLVI